MTWKLKWAFLIACCPLSVHLYVNFSQSNLLRKNHWANFNQNIQSITKLFTKKQKYIDKIWKSSSHELVGQFQPSILE